MKKILFISLIILSLSVNGLAGQSELDHQIDIVQKFIAAKYTNNYESLKKLSIHNDNLKLLLKGSSEPRTDNEKKKINDFLSGISVTLLDSNQNNKTRKIFSINFSGMIMPIDLVKAENDWKVDAKWWVALAQPPSEEIQIARHYLYSIIMKQASDLEKLSVPNDNLFTLIAGAEPPSGEAGQYQHLCYSMPMLEVKLGEKYIDFSGITQTHNEKDYLVLQALFGFSAKKVAFKLINIKGKWLVNPEPFIALALSKESTENINKAKLEFESKVFRGQLFEVLNEPGNVALLNSYLKDGFSTELKTDLLNGAYNQYWYNNQSGELSDNSNWIQIITLLIDNGADIESIDWSGRTLLMRTIEAGNGHNKELVKLLIQKGANINAKTKDGKTVLTIANRHKEKYYDILKNAGAQ